MNARSILIVDDDPIFCEVMTQSIVSAGFVVECADGTQNCLKMIDAAGREGAPMAMILDLFMPEEDGFDLMRALAARKFPAPIIVATAIGPEYLRAAKDFGRLWGLNIVDTLMKPLHTEPLLAQLQHLRAPNAAPPARSLTILVVDDDDDVRGVPARLLRRAGHRVIEASGGREALDQIRTAGDIDVLLTDIDMPIMNGVELAFSARKLRPNLRVIFTSGKTAESPIAHVLFLPKPYTKEQLLRLLDAPFAN
jgi:CheY-like chemotaxis protein